MEHLVTKPVPPWSRREMSLAMFSVLEVKPHFTACGRC